MTTRGRFESGLALLAVLLMAASPSQAQQEPAAGKLVFAGSPMAADCNTELKPTDGYEELSAKLKCLSDKIKALEGGGGSVAPSQLQGPSAKATGSAVAGQYQVDLQACRRSGSSVKCELIITSTGKDGSFNLGGESRLFDLQGREFEPTSREIAGGSAHRKDLIADVPTPAIITFGIDDGVAGISSLRLYVWGSDLSPQILSFRSVSIR